MKVINEYIIINPNISSTTSSGIILNDAKAKNIGVIVGLDEAINGLNISDKVVFDETKAISFSHNGQNYLACKYEDIIAKLN